MDEPIRVAIIVGEEVIAYSDDPASVRVAAGLIASAPGDVPNRVLAPIIAGRREACRVVALGAA